MKDIYHCELFAKPTVLLPLLPIQMRLGMVPSFHLYIFGQMRGLSNLLSRVSWCLSDGVVVVVVARRRTGRHIRRPSVVRYPYMPVVGCRVAAVAFSFGSVFGAPYCPACKQVKVVIRHISVVNSFHVCYSGWGGHPWPISV